MISSISETLNKLEPFEYSPGKQEYKTLPVFGPKRLKTGGIYTGQWKQD